jgi:serine/threonine protein kinase
MVMMGLLYIMAYIAEWRMVMSTVPQHIGKYELKQHLGRGSAGEVWKGHNPLLHQDVAIKLLYPDLQSDPNFMKHFAQQGHLLASLHYSNLVRIREVNISRPPEANETTAYVVMDYIEGQTLADYINTMSHKGIFPSPEQIVYLFTSLGIAIDYGHQRGFVHGNIKPGNILLARQNTKRFEGGEPLLSDFGLAQLLGNAAGISSPLYMSPEQAKGHAITGRSDIYSLGVMLYEICTGVQPFRDESSVAIMMQHINTLPTPPGLINANIPTQLSEVILRAMSKDPDARYTKASLLATAIADACSLQSMPNISNEKMATGNEEETYTRNTNTGSILGVSQPMPKLPLHAPISQPLPRVSGPLTGISGKYPIIRTNPSMPVPALNTIRFGQSGKLPTVSTGNTTETRGSGNTQPNKIVVPLVPPVIAQLPAPPVVKTPIKQPRFTDTPIYLACVVLFLVLFVLVSALGANLLLKSRQQSTTGTKIVTTTGHAFFLDDALGHNDQVRIEMQNVPAPANGKNYVAWFQDENGHMQLLGPLTLQDGTIIYTYPGDKTHSDLLTKIQGFSITQENSGSTPQAPSNQTVYQAQFATTVQPYLKNILYATPGLPNHQSVVTNLLETIKSLNDKAGSIDDSLQVRPDYGLVRRQATRIIEVIDGTTYALSTGDLPNKYLPLEHVPIGLLSSPRQQGYLDILAAQLDAFKRSAQGDQAQLEHVQNVENALSDLRNWVQKMRVYDVDILKAAALNNPTITNIALQLKNTAVDSYVGHTVPPDPAPKPVLGSAGASQAYIEAQYIAELDFQHT